MKLFLTRSSYGYRECPSLYRLNLQIINIKWFICPLLLLSWLKHSIFFRHIFNISRELPSSKAHGWFCHPGIINFNQSISHLLFLVRECHLWHLTWKLYMCSTRTYICPMSTCMYLCGWLNFYTGVRALCPSRCHLLGLLLVSPLLP